MSEKLNVDLTAGNRYDVKSRLDGKETKGLVLKHVLVERSDELPVIAIFDTGSECKCDDCCMWCDEDMYEITDSQEQPQ